MARRGDVLRLKRRLGFGAKGEAESVVIAQAEPLNRVLASVVVVPLDPAVDLFNGHPAVVSVSAAEAGASVDQVAVTTQLRVIRVDHLAPGVVGRLQPETLAALDRALRLVLGL